MATERTYIMVKPDGVERGLVGEILKRFEQKGYKLLALELMHPTKELLEQHYGDLKTKSFFPKLVAYMLSGPVVGKFNYICFVLALLLRESSSSLCLYLLPL